MASRSNSVAVQNANIRYRADQVVHQVEAEASWIEKKLKPSKVTARYPIKGAALLYATCGFGSLGDALFGYNSGDLELASRSRPRLADNCRYHVWIACESRLCEALLR
jgi:hypothetical protein